MCSHFALKLDLIRAKSGLLGVIRDAKVQFAAVSSGADSGRAKSEFRLIYATTKLSEPIEGDSLEQDCKTPVYSIDGCGSGGLPGSIRQRGTSPGLAKNRGKRSGREIAEVRPRRQHGRSRTAGQSGCGSEMCELCADPGRGRRAMAALPDIPGQAHQCRGLVFRLGAESLTGVKPVRQ